jgi:hypothetical protein
VAPVLLAQPSNDQSRFRYPTGTRKRNVAIKVSVVQFSERFEREAQAIAVLNHSTFVGKPIAFLSGTWDILLDANVPVTEGDLHAWGVCRFRPTGRKFACGSLGGVDTRQS